MSVNLRMTRTVRQPEGSALCVAACVATLLGVDAEVLPEDLIQKWFNAGVILPEKSGTFRIPWYMPLWGAVTVLAPQGVGAGVGVSWDVESPAVLDRKVLRSGDACLQLSDILISMTPALVTVKSAYYPNGLHSVVWDNEQTMFRDPAGSRAVDDYEIVEWHPICTYENYQER